MFFLYDILISIAWFFLRIVAGSSAKMKLFVSGRKSVFTNLSEKISSSDKTIWFHAASLGEYEQGLPVMEQMRLKFPSHKMVLTFFSPSGYEVRKNNTVANVTVYLPMDTVSNAKKFLDIVHPEIVFMIKYEYWPNYLNELKKRNIRTFLVSGIFRENQVFFKWYGNFYRKALDAFEHFFVQNATSKELLAKLEKFNATVSGDTRFDRVAAILEKDNSLEVIEKFCHGKLTVVIGSSWPEDELLLSAYINQGRNDIKYIFAPHNIKEPQIAKLKDGLLKNVLLFSDREGKNLSEYDVLIVDNVGMLTKIYSYADIAYVGGGFGNPGVHNILEPATFGVPVVIGPNYSHFAEATALVNMGGCVSIKTGSELTETLDALLSNSDERLEKGHICSTFVQMNKGAVDKIVTYFEDGRND
ncbi:3-deoxy-D-manno-octulosonic acid transferase [Flavobacterium silvaticum]|uniref:3-deoxy-D-manno-octulosonic acid transferase n=1 Tax=Flavobacterium silvaticum TaxID=1852020 RepID=A0A972FKQ6_9FLAO|nr:glycosyltransferase N-terminal domain-containing protein [Flavobacterium silvaticum]NMH27467.1 3-deoxy-D-manno-octulosonic acid transferase [Flavobacterium silvaticum]